MAWATVSPRITRILPPAASSVVSISAIALSSQRVSGLGERLLKSSTAIAWRTLAAFPAAVFGAAGPRCLRMWAPVTITSAAARPQAVQTRGRRQRGTGGFAGADAGAGASTTCTSTGNGSGVTGRDVGTGPAGAGASGGGGSIRIGISDVEEGRPSIRV